MRDEIKQKLKKQADGGGADYKLLRNIRNSLAHANRNNIKEVQQALSSDESLKQKLNDLFSKLLPPNLQ